MELIFQYDPHYSGHCVTVVRSFYVQGLYFYPGYIMFYLNLEAIVLLSDSNLYMVATVFACLGNTLGVPHLGFSS